MQVELPLPPTDTDLFGFTTCDNHEYCHSGPFPLSQVFAVSKHFGKEEHVFHFCSEACANYYYLERLRAGL